MAMFDGMFRLGSPPDYEPKPAQSIAAIAARAGCSPEAVAYEMLLDNEGSEVIYFPLFSYSERNLDGTYEMLQHPNTLASLADGGAHLGIMNDASMPTFLLTHWARDRKRGPRIALEKVVMLQTSCTADAYGLRDRGRLAVGYKADINVIDFDNLQIEAPYWVHDLPANGRRFMQRVRGYDATLVSGVITSRNGEATGALPGKLIRGPQRAAI
jgi:N-acyl-D-aspartate/D-glutamate deacylase